MLNVLLILLENKGMNKLDSSSTLEDKSLGNISRFSRDIFDTSSGVLLSNWILVKQEGSLTNYWFSIFTFYRIVIIVKLGV